VGEPEDVRESGNHVDFCVGSLHESLDGVTAEQVAGSGGGDNLVLAYEPVWAIGTGKTAGPDDAQEMCAALRSQLGERFGERVAASVRVLYGGSVKPSNARDLLGQADVDGALVGGASLDAGQFAQICRYRELAA
jgi:triosephosphate isomerase